MLCGLLLPCRIVICHDPSYYSVRLPGETEIEVLLSPCEFDGVMEPQVYNRVSSRIQSSKQQHVWLPQPDTDLGFFRSLREGGSYLGDILLNGEWLSEFILSRDFASKRGDSPEWLADEWVRQWSL